MSSNWLASAVTDSASSTLLSIQAQTGTLANSAIGAGTVFLQKGQYDKAIKAFQQAAAFAPNSADAYALMGKTYTFMNRTDDAIKAYKQAVHADPTYTAAGMELGTLYMKTERYDEAEKSFQNVLKNAPGTSDAVLSLGYVYLSTDRLSEAAVQFEKAARLLPKDPGSHFGLGQVRAKQKDFSAAVDQFTQAIQLNRKFASAYQELAFTYLAQGKTDLADQQVGELQQLGTDESLALADQVQLAMFTPKISYLDSAHSTFRLLGTPGTTVASLDPSLATPGASKMLAVSFVFNQPMDASAMQNVYNWSISKAAGGTAGVYNNGANLHPEKEANILPFPISVTWDKENNRATVYFRITQNSTGDAVIDPSHWVFQFRGTDSGGNPMDPKGDQFDGWSGLRF